MKTSPDQDWAWERTHLCVPVELTKGPGSPQKTTRRHGCLRSRILAILAASACSAAAQNPSEEFAIVRSAIAGGGGVSTGGDFTLADTIAQPEAGGSLEAGDFSVTGGFRAQRASVAIEGGPVLTIANSQTGTVTISWLPATPGFVLQESSSLTSDSWVNSESGGSSPIDVPASGPTRYYRLQKP